jgi:hypothetical protein
MSLGEKNVLGTLFFSVIYTHAKSTSQPDYFSALKILKRYYLQ